MGVGETGVVSLIFLVVVFVVMMVILWEKKEGRKIVRETYV